MTLSSTCEVRAPLALSARLLFSVASLAVGDATDRHRRRLFVLPPLSADPSDPGRLSGETRNLGLCVCRSTAVILLSPDEGFEEIANPYADEEEED